MAFLKRYRQILFSDFFRPRGVPVPHFGSTNDVVAVLSSNSAPYQQAFEGFQQAFGHSVPSYILSEGDPKIPSGTRVIVAIGGKAALYPYSSGHVLIYCLAPGTKLNPEEHSSQLLNIHNLSLRSNHDLQI